MTRSNRSAEFYIRELESLSEHHCAKILSQAQEQAREIVKPAFHQARQRAHSVLTQERELLKKRLQAAEARFRSAQLQHQQRQQNQLLQLAYEDLRRQLGEYWLDPARRRQWVYALLDEAVERLPQQSWRVLHPPDWPVQEIETARAYAQSQGVESPVFAPDGDLPAGLRIRCQGVVLDASVAGLASDRRRIEARLLALLNDQDMNTNDEQRTHPLD